MLGEHGELSVPLRDHVCVDGADVHPTAAQLADAERYLRTWYPRHVALDSGRSSTWTSGLGLSRMVAALGGEGELWPASVVLDGEYGIVGAAVTVPVTLARGGSPRRRPRRAPCLRRARPRGGRRRQRYFADAVFRLTKQGVRIGPMPSSSPRRLSRPRTIVGLSRAMRWRPEDEEVTG